MGRLMLNLLGSPEVSHAGKTLTFRTRKVFALLVYLAVENGRHSRDKMSALLWPESDEERAKASLRRTLAYLRTGLAEAPHGHISASASSLSHILGEHDILSFNQHADFELDLSIMQDAYTLARRRTLHDPATLPAHVAQLRDALSRYRGDFLDGFSLPDASDFEDWLLLQRETWHRRATTLFNRLSQLQNEGGELENALETATRWVRHDPLNEAAYVRLIELHYALGDRTAALQASEQCRTMLERELNAEPTPETRTLVERIRLQVPAKPNLTPPQTHAPQSLTNMPLIGRQTEHLALVTAYHTTQQRAQLVILEGEPGIGKTRLAKEFLRWATAQGADVLQGRAYETGGSLPYQPLIDALRNRLEIEKHFERLLSDTWLAELSRLFPELRDRYPELHGPLMLEENEARVRLFEAVARFVQSLGKQVPVIFFIDDAQWADIASLDMLQYVMLRCAEANLPLLVLLTVRAEDLATNTALATSLTSLERNLSLLRLSLAPLTSDDTLHFVQSLLKYEGTRPGFFQGKLEAFSQQLFTETGGHPFFLVETLKDLVERGTLQPGETEGWDIDFDLVTQNYGTQHHTLPRGVRELVRTRIMHLSAPALALCIAGAILGDGFNFEHVRYVADVPESEALSYLEELLLRGLLRESGGHCFFVHDKIREVAYGEAGEIRRRVLHRRALEVMEREGASPAALARHALGASLMDRAFHFSLAAGNEAMRVFAVRNALDYYEQARDLSVNGRTGQFASSDLQHLYTQLGRVYELNNQREQARTTYEAMLMLAREHHANQMECAALNALAILYAQELGKREQVDALLLDAFTVARRSGDTISLLNTDWNLAQAAFYALDWEKALLHGEQALTLVRELNEKEYIARSLNQLAIINLQLCKLIKAEQYAQEARVLYKELGNRAMEVDTIVLLAEAYIIEGRLAEGIEIARIAFASSLEIENAWAIANSAHKLSIGLIDCGEYTEALKIVQVGVAQARVAKYPPLLVFTLETLGRLYRTLFALDAALAAHQEAKALSEPFKHPYFLELCLAGLCADAAVAGNWVEAYACAHEALSVRNYGMPYVGLTRWYETEALLRSGESEQAKADVQMFGKAISESRRYRISFLRSLAILKKWQGEKSQAIDHLEEAVALAEEIGLLGELWQMEAELGELYQIAGQPLVANQFFAKAAEILQFLGNKLNDETLRATFLSAHSKNGMRIHLSHCSQTL